MWPIRQRSLILIVDDEPMNLRMLGATLAKNHEVAVATSGLEAIDYLSQGRLPNLILLDVLMPDLDGFEVCRRLKSAPQWRHLPIVFLTAATDVEAEKQGFAVGAVDYIHKPFDRDLVLARVNSHLTVHGMMDRLEETTSTVQYALPKAGPEALPLEEMPILSAVFQHSTEGIMVFDRDGTAIDVNPSFERITGIDRERVVGRGRKALQRELRRSEFSDYLWQQVVSRGHWRGELINRRVSGDSYPELRTFNTVTSSNGQVSHIVSVFSDISVTKKNQEMIDFLTWYDGLTSLPNRLLLMERLDLSLKLCRDNRNYSAIAVFDLERFKDINESLGLHTGDQILMELGSRLQAFCRHTETIARLDSDEFAFLLGPLATTIDQSAHLALARTRELEEELRAPYEVDGQTIHLSANVGICLVPPLCGEHSPENAVKMAETALHRAKIHPSESILFFEEDMARESRELFRIAQGLRMAIQQHQLDIHLQSQVSLDGALQGVEALARWVQPGYGPVSPGQFIPVAESSDLIVHLDRCVLDQALAFVDRHRQAMSGVRMAVNISPRHFAQEDFVDYITRSLRWHSLPGHTLTLELTESIMLQEFDAVVARMRALSGLGVNFSIDDFGTGYSSLSYLRHLPIQELKIDRSFTSEIASSQGGQSIVKLVHGMAQEMGLRTVVEGVETEAQVNFLRQCGDLIMQGYLIGRPQPAETWIEDQAQPRRQRGA